MLCISSYPLPGIYKSLTTWCCHSWKGHFQQDTLSLSQAQTVKNLSVVLETHVGSLGWEDPLEKGMVTHSSILARRIPWTEEPGGLQSMRSQSQTRLNRLSMHAHSRLTMSWWFQLNSEGTQPYVYMYPFSPKLPPIQAATQHWAEFHVLYGRSLLVIHFKYSSVYLSIPNSLTTPSPVHLGHCNTFLVLDFIMFSPPCPLKLPFAFIKEWREGLLEKLMLFLESLPSLRLEDPHGL